MSLLLNNMHLACFYLRYSIWKNLDYHRSLRTIAFSKKNYLFSRSPFWITARDNCAEWQKWTSMLCIFPDEKILKTSLFVVVYKTKLKYLILNPKTCIFLLVLVYTSLRQLHKCNTLLLRISSIISITAFCTIWLDFQQRDFVSFVLEFLKLNGFYEDWAEHFLKRGNLK